MFVYFVIYICFAKLRLSVLSHGCNEEAGKCCRLDFGAVSEAHWNCKLNHLEVERFPIVELSCLDFEVFGRCSQDSLWVVNAALAARVRQSPPRVIRGTHLFL